MSIFSDLVYAYNKLLPPTSYGKSLGENSEFTSSSISFYWGMKRKMPEFHVHNIFLAEKYKSSFDDIFKRHLLPEDPSFYINVPSRIDSSGNFALQQHYALSKHVHITLTFILSFSCTRR